VTRGPTALCLLLALVIGGCGSSATASGPPSASANEPSTQPSPSLATASPSPSPTPSPTATPKPTEAAWQDFTSPNQHYTMQFPPGWFARPGDSQHLDEFDSLAFARLYVGQQDSRQVVDVDRVLSTEISHLKGEISGKVVSNKPIKLAGGYAGRIVELVGTDFGRPVSLTHILVAKGKRWYWFNYFIDYPDTSPGRELLEPTYKTWRPTA
jgi:hypothetical protein